jgi:hypothetical protein
MSVIDEHLAHPGLEQRALRLCSSSICQPSPLQGEAFSSNLGRNMKNCAVLAAEPSRNSSRRHHSTSIWRTPLTLALPPTHIAAS